MANVRMITEEGTCHRSCVFYRDCRKHLEKYGLCPEWAIDTSLVGPQSDLEKVFIITKHLAYCRETYWKREARPELIQNLKRAAKLYGVPEELLMKQAKKQLGLRSW